MIDTPTTSELLQIVSDQRFDTFDQWVSRAFRWLTSHPEYNNTEHGGDGWRGRHFTAICFDQFGRRCHNGGDFMRARDEGAFPVFYLWPDQLLALAQDRIAQRPQRRRAGARRYLASALKARAVSRPGSSRARLP